MIKVGDTVNGSVVYGKKNTLVGKVTNIEHPESEGRYILNDVVTIEWDNGQTAKFHYEHLRGYLVK